ncbi:MULTISPECIES: copper amine oxidase N-terminal domain-containing protein [Lysinibacillus]|uniref:copper amine oxidase N-terminal domain-containing protein n=1 Tax=Lysinibacillus TaxID=400634 RepID=UPI000E201DC2|nr:copper amine oxidase N-terminal domain-containing protein [Lysinibacillus capsici]MCT1538276.1 copper amine oxidase N-terminal domain-containing protein [Lysinibacillus capsici]MCT1568984.1 copper amine oxidase N-terminal domain-containing protein [Lysinibacillus capsici]MCT1646000.1 copper amine oxidase N-terminal domain-containing protein [Lysinibacillus capsici]MCT1725495.1 copper amine oxidase N-terminal domain-containing protein [Lysinibacillus capsici]MCT1784274.1 copper amine oxidase
MRIIKILLIISLIWPFVDANIANADDEEDYKKYEGDVHKKHNDDYDDDEEDDDYDYDYYKEEDEYEYYDQRYPETNSNTWNIWTRSTYVNKGELPLKEAKEIQLKLENNNNTVSLYLIPLDGEIYVPGKIVAELLGAKVVNYDNSKILEINKAGTELIFRAGTNVVYYNEIKTPIPAVTFYLNDNIYVPISVISNGLGYVAEWQEMNNAVVLKLLK